MTSKEKKANSCYKKELDYDARYIEEYIKHMYMIAGRFIYRDFDNKRPMYSNNENIYEIDLDNIFEKAQKDTYGRFLDENTSYVYALLARTYKLIIMGIYIIEAENNNIRNTKSPIGNCGISVTSMIMQVILNNLATLHDIANKEQGFTFVDNKFIKQYSLVEQEINSKKCIKDIIKRLISEYNKIGIWKSKHPTKYDIGNLYNILKHGIDASDFFERSDRQTLIDNVEHNVTKITNGMTETIWFNDKCKEMLKICKKAFENNLFRLNKLLA